MPCPADPEGGGGVAWGRPRQAAYCHRHWDDGEVCWDSYVRIGHTVQNYQVDIYLQPNSRYNWGQIRRFGGGRGQEFATAYSVQYWSSGAWHTYTNLTGHSVMTGNENTWEASVQQLVPPIVTSRVRVLPRSRHPRTVSNFDDGQVGDNFDADGSGTCLARI